jgi:hypothetical protein
LRTIGTPGRLTALFNPAPELHPSGLRRDGRPSKIGSMPGAYLDFQQIRTALRFVGR